MPLIIPPFVQEFVNEIGKKYNKKINIRSKSEPDWMLKIVGFVAKIFNKRFDTGYITTIGNTIWVPEHFFDKSPKAALEIIIHEVIHMYDAKRLTMPLFGLIYLSPQILASLALLSVFGGGWLWCLLFLLCLAPIPSPGRMWLEMRGYRSNMMYSKYVYNMNNEALNNDADFMASQFVEAFYYWMWPFKGHVVSMLIDEKYEKEMIYVEILDWLRQRKLVKDFPKPLPYSNKLF